MKQLAASVAYEISRNLSANVEREERNAMTVRDEEQA